MGSHGSERVPRLWLTPASGVTCFLEGTLLHKPAAPGGAGSLGKVKAAALPWSRPPPIPLRRLSGAQRPSLLFPLHPASPRPWTWHVTSRSTCCRSSCEFMRRLPPHQALLHWVREEPAAEKGQAPGSVGGCPHAGGVGRGLALAFGERLAGRHAERTLTKPMPLAGPQAGTLSTFLPVTPSESEHPRSGRCLRHQTERPGLSKAQAGERQRQGLEPSRSAPEPRCQPPSISTRLGQGQPGTPPQRGPPFTAPRTPGPRERGQAPDSRLSRSDCSGPPCPGPGGGAPAAWCPPAASPPSPPAARVARPPHCHPLSVAEARARARS